MMLNIIKYILLNAVWMPTFLFFIIMQEKNGLSLLSILLGCFTLIVFIIAMIQGAKIKPWIWISIVLFGEAVVIEQIMIVLEIQKETILFRKF
ncbi:hypothetical protein ACQKMD_21370 [Viridibacillus sp. NPDC096237]|uniref:hypothetical protein n=1 Tax=Viridibacillus sp. NPDC096237 TaxID=3390721 RepID=UPI003D089F32